MRIWVLYHAHAFEHPCISTDVTDQKRTGTLNDTDLGMNLIVCWRFSSGHDGVLTAHLPSLPPSLYKTRFITRGHSVELCC